MIFEVMDESPEILDTPHAKPLNPARGEVIFEQVDFNYRQPSEAEKELAEKAGKQASKVKRSFKDDLPVAVLHEVNFKAILGQIAYC
ncbi:MAG: hypothetical protein R2865_14070 [Deinococcales bacterium]